MGSLDFGQPAAPPIAQHLHDDGDAVDGDATKGLQHGLLAKHEAKAQPAKLVSADPLEFRWRVPSSWLNNPSSVPPYIETSWMHRPMIR